MSDDMDHFADADAESLWRFDDGEGIGCGHCSNSGWHIICPDDMCRGQYDGDEFAPCGDSNCVRPCQHCNKEGLPL